MPKVLACMLLCIAVLVLDDNVINTRYQTGLFDVVKEAPSREPLSYLLNIYFVHVIYF